MQRKVFDRKVFNRKLVLITGSCAGIGRALAVRMAQAGARLVIFDLHQDALDGLVQHLADHQIDDRLIARQLAILSSMTPKERRNPQILHASRKRRIAAGSGTAVPEVNKLLKQYQQMQTMMKRVKKMGHKQFMARGLPPGLLQR